MKSVLHLSLAAALLCAATVAHAGPDTYVPGQKLDSGLGELPHYSKWADATGRAPLGLATAPPAGHPVPGESLDDGLAELPHYSKWLDKSGRDPLGRLAAPVVALSR